jgi:hypothetical protein
MEPENWSGREMFTSLLIEEKFGLFKLKYYLVC